MPKTEEPIVVEQTFNTSVENVWSAITTLHEMKQWFFENIPSFNPVVGFETRFVVKVGDRIFPHIWKLTEVEPYRRITYDWRYEGYTGRAYVTFELFPQGEQSRLRLTFKAVEPFPEYIPEFKRESGVEGWKYFINKRLKNYLEASQ
ncbi:MAG: SRPBCC domain-containing protein [Caldithrix sp.]|nr:SRPBCC domain-containing protein [Caldithrix sp.]